MDQARADELFAAFGPVRVKRMFGGAGLFADGLMFALEAGGALYFKTGPSNVGAFEAEGLTAFGYGTKAGRRVLTSYRLAPDRVFDDPAEMERWARSALEAARQTSGAR